jgi:hypothetical protein
MSDIVDELEDIGIGDLKEVFSVGEDVVRNVMHDMSLAL